MTIREAKKIGRKKILKATGLIFAVLILFTLIGTRGKNPVAGRPSGVIIIVLIQTLIFLAIIFSLTYMLGSKAGEEVIIRKKNFLMVSIKYVAVISFAVAFYYTIVWMVNGSYVGSSLAGVFMGTFVPLFMKTAFVLLIVWIYSTFRMNALAENTQIDR